MSSRRCTTCTSARRTGPHSARTSHCFLRSSLKPIQAVPTARGLRRSRLRRARDRERVAPGRAGAARRRCGSCSRAPAPRWTTSRCGSQDGRPDGPLGHNCSGKHAGMLAACRAHDWPLHPYRELSTSAAAARRRARRPRGRRRRRLRRADVRNAALRDGGALRDDAGADRSRDARASGARRRQRRGRHRPDARAPRLDREARRRRPADCARAGRRRAGRSRPRTASSRALRPAIGQVLGIDAFRTVDVRNTPRRGRRLGRDESLRRSATWKASPGSSSGSRSPAVTRCTRRGAGSTPARSTPPCAARRPPARRRSSSWTATAPARGGRSTR